MEQLYMDVNMLKDDDRNASYRAAIAEQLAVLKARNMPLTRILDIGAGTSLLALMAAEEAERLNMSVDVHTCELDSEMAAIARATLAANSSTAQLHTRDSKSLTTRELGGSVHLLISEIVDSELLGEGMLSSLKAAAAQVAAEGCVSIPCAADVILQPVAAPVLQRWVGTPPNHPLEAHMAGCTRSRASFKDYHVERLPGGCVPLADPARAFRFDLSTDGVMALEDRATADLEFAVHTEGTHTGYVLWWNMYLTPSVVISTAPLWVSEATPWREHWLPCLAALNTPRAVVEGDVIAATITRDLYSFALELPTWEGADTADPQRCSCHVHDLMSSSSMALLHSTQHQAAMHAAIREATRDHDAIYLSGTIGQLADTLQRTTCDVFFHTAHVAQKRLVEHVMRHVGGADRFTAVVDQPAHVPCSIFEPNAPRGEGVLDSLHMYTAGQWTYPRAARVMMQLVHVHTLYDCMHPDTKTQGFDMSPFVAACAHVGSFAVQHHTWEQEYDPCAAPCEMQVLASGAGHVHVQDVCHVTMTSSRSLNCALVWVEWDVTAADTDRTAAPSSDSSQQLFVLLAEPVPVSVDDVMDVQYTLRLDDDEVDLAIHVSHRNSDP